MEPNAPERLQLHLITLGPSHYCEKARWALERSAANFQETSHFPGLHVLFLKKFGGGTTVPKLIIRDGEEKNLLHDSSDIVEFSDTLIEAREEHLYPADKREAVRKWEEEFNNVLGRQTRKWAYCYLAYHKSLYRVLSQGTSAFEKVLGFLLLPVVRHVIYNRHGCNEPNAKNVAHGKIMAVFEKVSSALQDGRAFICGETFTAADLTFAALAGPAVVPPGYGCKLPQLEELPEEMAEQVKRFRNLPAGKHVLRLYQTYRQKKLV